MTNLTKISMNLTKRDIENTDKLKERFHARTKADTVSAALSITASLSEHLENGEQLFIRTKDGHTQQVIIPGLD